MNRDGRRLSIRWPAYLVLLSLACGAMALVAQCEHQAAANVSAAPSGDTRVNPNLFVMRLTAVDKTGVPLTTLRAEDVRELEDGVPQEIQLLTRVTDEPIQLTLGVDLSISQTEVLPLNIAAAHKFIDTLLRAKADPAAVYSFSGQGMLKQPLTNDRKALHDVLNDLHTEKPPNYIGHGVIIGSPPIIRGDQQLSGATSLWDAIRNMAQGVYPTAHTAHRVTILMTDGVDTSSTSRKREALEALMRAGVYVYAIGLAGEDGYLNKDDLRKLAEETGGRAFFPRNNKELDQVIEPIEPELRAPYLLGYYPAAKPTNNARRKLQIEIINPELRKQNWRLAYPHGYFFTDLTKSAAPAINH